MVYDQDPSVGPSEQEAVCRGLPDGLEIANIKSKIQALKQKEQEQKKNDECLRARIAEIDNQLAQLQN